MINQIILQKGLENIPSLTHSLLHHYNQVIQYQN